MQCLFGGIVPVGVEYRRSYKASGCEFSSQKAPQFAKNVTLFTFPYLNLNTSNAHFFFLLGGRNLTLMNKFRVLFRHFEAQLIQSFSQLLPSPHEAC